MPKNITHNIFQLYLLDLKERVPNQQILVPQTFFFYLKTPQLVQMRSIYGIKVLRNKRKLLPKKFKEMAKQKNLPKWIRGDLANTDQDDYFISEDESEKRLFIAVQIFITLLLLACCILVEKCSNNSSFSVKRRIIHSSKGKKI